MRIEMKLNRLVDWIDWNDGKRDFCRNHFPMSVWKLTVTAIGIQQQIYVCDAYAVHNFSMILSQAQTTFVWCDQIIDHIICMQ